MKRFLRYIDTISRMSGTISSWFIILQIVVTVAIVVERHLFHKGDDWAFELSWMFYSMVWLFAFAYTLAEKGHVKVDPLFNLYPPRVQAIMETLSHLFLLILCGVIVGYGIIYAKAAWAIKECSWHTIVGAPVYPIKTMIPIAFGLLGLQAAVEIIRHATIAVRGKEL